MTTCGRTGPPGVRALAPRIRGQALFYLWGQGTGDGLWRLQDDQATEIWRGSRGALLEAASISPDGLRVAVVLRQGGKQTLTLERVDGSQPRAIGESIDVAGTSDWSPDGQWVVVGGEDRNRVKGLFKIPVDGGEPVPRDDRTGIRPGVVPGRRPHRLRRCERGRSSPAAGGSTRWNARGTAASANGRLHHVWTASISAGWPWCRVREAEGGSRRSGLLAAGSGHQEDAAAGRADLDHESGRDRNFDITSDGKHIVFDRSSDNSDIVLINLPQRRSR